jgi:hypothetical protein
MVYVALFPDAPMELADTVQAKLLSGFGVTTEVLNRTPAPRPAMFVKFLGVGGVQRDRVTDVPTLAVEAWASMRVDAHLLAQQVRAIMHSLEGQTFAGYSVQEVVEFAGPADLPDPLSDQYRYSATYAVAIRSDTVVNL